MFKHGDCSTEVDRRPFLFTLIAFLGGTAAAVLLFVLGRGNPLSIFAGILIAIVAVAALVVLFAILTDYAYVENGMLKTRYLFKRTSTPLSQIEKVTCRDKVYYVYGKHGEVAATVNGLLTGIDTILTAFEKHGVRFE